MNGTHALLRQPARLDWETPQPLFDMLIEFRFTLDVCASVDNAKCEHFFTEFHDGLKQDWSFNVCWMNPPYGREIKRWVEKARRASLAGATVVCLLPARTDVAWWHDDVEYGADEKRFLRGRLKFARSDGKRSQAPFPSVIVVFRAAVARRESA